MRPIMIVVWLIVLVNYVTHHEEMHRLPRYVMEGKQNNEI